MINETQGRPESRRDLLIVLAIWLVVSCFMAWNARMLVAQRMFPDPDDAMRLVQVRDWLAGQSWFDVTQYRLSPPWGAPMHWSRIVDVPIGLVILIFRPFLGEFGAESAALFLIPLMTLGITMLLMYRLASKLSEGSAALLAVLATPASLGAMKQMKIMRIDHHGWQIVLALVAMLGMLDIKRPLRGGAIAGVAVAFWLNISIEGLPFAAAIGAWFALEWLLDASAGERLRSYLGSLALASAALFASTHAPSTWLGHPHDVLNVAHIAAFSAAWLCCLAAVRPNVADRWIRAGLLALAAVISGAAMFAVDVHALADPFSSLDPFVRAYWYNGVDEGRPAWQIAWSYAAEGLAQPVVGLAGALVAIGRTRGAQRYAWVMYAYLLGSITLSALFVIREATTASVLSLAGTAFLCDLALRHTRKVSLMPVRVVGTAGALLIMAPAYAAPALVMPADPRLIKAMASSDSCVTKSELDKLASLPPSNLATPLDITPAILAGTPHRMIAGGYHRDNAGIHEVILLFIGSEGVARQILARRHIDYVVFCPNTPESIWWAHHGPDGLSAKLNANQVPAWLDPVDLHLKSLRVWRVRKDLLAAQPSA
ncbi:MAG TPA: hypothetical protein VFW35_03480 [Sphingomicrobium sp.]|nr:hypothetical protein [Sphingomicrobium sp.]